MEALDKIKEYKLKPSTIEYINDTIDEYQKYLEMIDGLVPSEKDIFLRTLKRMELKNNQEMEQEDPFMLELELNSNNGMIKSSIDVMTNIILSNQPLTTRKLEQVHRLLITGTSDDKKENYQVRNFETYVCEVKDGKEILSYIPPSKDEIKPYLKKLYSFMKEASYSSKIDVFYKPFIEHFYIAALQPFGNGNTRLARLFEYSEIFKLTRQNLNSKIESPVLYMSKNHLLTRKYYRDSISKIVLEPSDDNINKWVEYNLNMVNEQMYYCENALSKKYK